MKTRFVKIAQLTFAWALLIPLLACEPETKKIQIRPDVHASRTEMTVKNTDGFDWTSVEVGVGLTNSGPFYGTKIPLLPKGDVRTIDLNDLDYNGQRFNPFAQKAAVYYVECQTPQGKGWWSGSKD